MDNLFSIHKKRYSHLQKIKTFYYKSCMQSISLYWRIPILKLHLHILSSKKTCWFCIYRLTTERPPRSHSPLSKQLGRYESMQLRIFAPSSIVVIEMYCQFRWVHYSWARMKQVETWNMFYHWTEYSIYRVILRYRVI